jgi:hypothetical protein
MRAAHVAHPKKPKGLRVGKNLRDTVKKLAPAKGTVKPSHLAKPQWTKFKPGL